jgi:hypothetical protein
VAVVIFGDVWGLEAVGTLGRLLIGESGLHDHNSLVLGD